MARSGGFTLLELMVTLVVAATLVAVGVPSFSTFIRANRATANTNDLIAALNLARSEAIHRGAAITVCSSENGTSCAGAKDWTTGWIVLAPGGELLRAWPERAGGADIVAGNVDTVTFQARGTAAGAALFNIRMPDCVNNEGRDVRVNAAGRISVERVDCG